MADRFESIPELSEGDLNMKTNDKTINYYSTQSALQYIMIFSVSHRLIICLSQIIDRLSTDKSRYFAQPRSVITNYHSAIEILIVTASAMNDSPSPLFLIHFGLFTCHLPLFKMKVKEVLVQIKMRQL